MNLGLWAFKKLAIKFYRFTITKREVRLDLWALTQCVYTQTFAICAMKLDMGIHKLRKSEGFLVVTKREVHSSKAMRLDMWAFTKRVLKFHRWTFTKRDLQKLEMCGYECIEVRRVGITKLEKLNLWPFAQGLKLSTK